MTRDADRVHPAQMLVTSQVGVIASSGASLRERAQDALSTITAALPASATAICLWDPLDRTHVSLANNSYPAIVLEHLNSWFVKHDPLYAQMRAGRTGALRWQDVKGYRHTRSVESVFAPAGFDEGLTARLVDAQGRYAGAFHLSCDDRRFPRGKDVALVNALRTSLACLLDVTATPRVMARLLVPAGEAFMMDGRGRSVPVFDGAGGPGHLGRDEELTRLLSAGPASEWQFRWLSGEEWWRVRALSLHESTIAGEPVRLVMATPQPLPWGITERELEVLTLLAGGHTNQQIGRLLDITARTAVHHVENIMAKVGAPNRGKCAAIAVVEGLLNPRVALRAGVLTAAAPATGPSEF